MVTQNDETQNPENNAEMLSNKDKRNLNAPTQNMGDNIKSDDDDIESDDDDIESGGYDLPDVIELESIEDLLAYNKIEFPPNPARINEVTTLSNMLAQPIHNNVLIVVSKLEDALPGLSLLEKIKRQINPNSSVVPISIDPDFGSDESDFFYKKREDQKEIFDALLDKFQESDDFPVLMDFFALIKADHCFDKLKEFLARPRPVIALVKAKDLEAVREMMYEEKDYQPSIASCGKIFPKKPFSSFSFLQISSLSLDEVKSLVKPHTDLFVNRENGEPLFSDELYDYIIQKGYHLIPPAHQLEAFESMFYILSLNKNLDGDLSVEAVDAYFKEANWEVEKTQTVQPETDSLKDNPILKCEEILNQKVLGQTNAIHQISELIQAKEFALTDEKRPIVLGFFGPSGVGKTETGKVLGPLLSGQESVLINMSEYQESHSISKFISSPPGYIGSDTPGLLYTIMKKNPKAVIILDEFEKANPTIHKLFLGVFDEGKASDSCAGSVNLSRATFILTSNAGITETAGLGFGENAGKVSYVADEKEIEHAFAPEFMGRLQGRILFNPLDEKTLRQIINLNLEPIQEALTKKFNVTLSMGDSARNQLLAEGMNPRYGARPLKNLIRTKITTPLSIQLQQGKFPAGSTIQVHFDAAKKVYTLAQKGVPTRVGKRLPPPCRSQESQKTND